MLRPTEANRLAFTAPVTNSTSSPETRETPAFSPSRSNLRLRKSLIHLRTVRKNSFILLSPHHHHLLHHLHQHQHHTQPPAPNLLPAPASSITHCPALLYHHLAPFPPALQHWVSTIMSSTRAAANVLFFHNSYDYYF